MIAPLTYTDRAATLARAYSRANRAGDAEDVGAVDPPTPPPAPTLPFLEFVDDAPEPEGAVALPAHLLDFKINNFEEQLTRTLITEDIRREASRAQAMLCARMFYGAGSRDGRAAVLGKLAETLHTSKRTIRRRARLGMMPPEDWNPELSLAVHLMACRTSDPRAALKLAVDYGLSAKGLRQYVETLELPGKRESLADESYDSTVDPEEAGALVDKVMRQARTRGRVKSYRVRVDVVYETEAA